jgi:hypothetical protein
MMYTSEVTPCFTVHIDVMDVFCGVVHEKNIRGCLNGRFKAPGRHLKLSLPMM